MVDRSFVGGGSVGWWLVVGVVVGGRWLVGWWIVVVVVVWSVVRSSFVVVRSLVRWCVRGRRGRWSFVRPFVGRPFVFVRRRRPSSFVGPSVRSFVVRRRPSSRRSFVRSSSVVVRSSSFVGGGGGLVRGGWLVGW